MPENEPSLPELPLLLDDRGLECSSVVANCRMNRERQLTGGNGYERELGLNPLDYLRQRAGSGHPVRWLDLCCGTGRALIEAAEVIDREGLESVVKIVGLDLVEMFRPHRHLPCLELAVGSIHHWAPKARFDLISCVHGLHYVGDKVRVIERAVSWLVEDGYLIAHLDTANLRRENGESLSRLFGQLARALGLVSDRRRKRISCHGRREIRFPLEYLGANDEAGPNYTGQPAVDSWYRERP